MECAAIDPSLVFCENKVRIIIGVTTIMSGVIPFMNANIKAFFLDSRCRLPLQSRPMHKTIGDNIMPNPDNVQKVQMVNIRIIGMRGLVLQVASSMPASPK